MSIALDTLLGYNERVYKLLIRTYDDKENYSSPDMLQPVALVYEGGANPDATQRL